MASGKLVPSALERRELSRLNTFEFWSRKLRRDVLLVGPAQFDACLILEFDRSVHTYCERPPLQVRLLPLSEKRIRCLDFYAERHDGRQGGIIVFEPRLKQTEDCLRRSIAASQIPVEIWMAADLAQRKQLIRNLKQLRPYVSHAEPIPENFRHGIKDFLKKYHEGSWDQLRRAISEGSSSDFARAISLLYHDGDVDLDISKHPLSSATWITSR